MLHMKRTNIHLAFAQIIKLHSYSKETGLTVAEIVRRAIDEFLEKEWPSLRISEKAERTE
jgi:predicted DNA-binding protein